MDIKSVRWNTYLAIISKLASNCYISNGLSENFKTVEVEVVDCPNLRDWDCPSEGISGNQKIIDVGGEPYMHDPKFIGAEFDYQEISRIIDSEKSYALGAGSGAMSCLDGHCGELVINENLITDESRSIIARVSPDKKCIVEKYSAKKHGGLGNIYYTDGKQVQFLFTLIGFKWCFTIPLSVG